MTKKKSKALQGLKALVTRVFELRTKPQDVPNAAQFKGKLCFSH